MNSGLTPEQQKRDHVSYNECEAMFHLAKTGRSTEDIAFMLERDHRTVRKHTEKQCGHP